MIMKVKIARLLLCYFIVQTTILVAFTLSFALPKYSFYAFFLFNFLWHLVIYFFLASNPDSFYKTETHEKLDELNLANCISLFRASAVMSVGFLIWHSENYTILICSVLYVIIIFLSDALDGFIARKKHEITKLGKQIDSMSDYALLIFMSALFYEKKILPLWFFVLLFVRFFIQAYGMVKFIALGCPIKPKSTIGGKITIASTMFLYFLALLSMLLKIGVLNKIVEIFTIMCGFLIFVFLFEKLFIFFQHWKLYKQNNS